jgi:hypothetical protein
MSAIPPVAAQERTLIQVRFVPQAAVSRCSKQQRYSIVRQYEKDREMR